MSAAIINRFAGLFGLGNQEDEYEDENEYAVNQYEEDQEEEYLKPKTRVRKSFSDIENNSAYGAKNFQTKVIPMNTAISSSKMVITQPTCYEDVEEVGSYLKNKKSVIINLENVSKEDARRILDFLSGSAFMIEGSIQKVSNLIYLMAPKSVEIQNDLEISQYRNQKSSFSWLK